MQTKSFIQDHDWFIGDLFSLQAELVHTVNAMSQEQK